MVSVGIDFGTSTTVAAAYQDGRPRVLRSPQGRDVVPSCVAFPPNGRVAVGQAARHRRVIDPSNALYSVKRILGHPWGRSEVTRFRESYPFELESGDDQVPRFVTRAGRLSPVEVASYLLAQVRESPDLDASQVDNVTLTVPAVFSPPQRHALQAAAARAGFEKTDILEEPCAAALAYLAGDAEEQVVVVYDLGGGTFDLTVMHWSGEDYQVLGAGGDSYTDWDILSSGGDSYLGGDDIDLSCANLVNTQVLERNRWDIRSSDTSFQKLLLSCEAAKRLISRADSQTIDLSPVDEVLRGETVQLSRSDVERLCAQLVRRTFIICDETLAKAGVFANQVDTVLLSGGSCHLPFIREGVGRYFGQAPRVSVDPDHAVAVGGALHAGRSAA